MKPESFNIHLDPGRWQALNTNAAYNKASAKDFVFAAHFSAAKTSSLKKRKLRTYIVLARVVYRVQNKI